jgi:hypothetical protein
VPQQESSEGRSQTQIPWHFATQLICQQTRCGSVARSRMRASLGSLFVSLICFHSKGWHRAPAVKMLQVPVCYPQSGRVSERCSYVMGFLVIEIAMDLFTGLLSDRCLATRRGIQCLLCDILTDLRPARRRKKGRRVAAACQSTTRDVGSAVQRVLGILRNGREQGCRLEILSSRAGRQNIIYNLLY